VKKNSLVGKKQANNLGKTPKREKFPNEASKKMAPARSLSSRH